MLMTDSSGVRLSARNCLAGTVKSVEPGAVNAEVVLTLAGGTEVAAIVTKEAVGDLGLKPGVARDCGDQGVARDPGRAELTRY